LVVYLRVNHSVPTGGKKICLIVLIQILYHDSEAARGPVGLRMNQSDQGRLNAWNGINPKKEKYVFIRKSLKRYLG
jgi:hypothetical protein